MVTLTRVRQVGNRFRLRVGHLGYSITFPYSLIRTVVQYKYIP